MVLVQEEARVGASISDSPTGVVIANVKEKPLAGGPDKLLPFDGVMPLIVTDENRIDTHLKGS